MELEDCAFPLLAGLDITADPNEAFDGCNIGLLVGARPRGPGMERSDLLEANGGIFKPQGEAINAHASDDVKILVVGNPANTNALIAKAHAPDVPDERFTAMMRLDHNRAISQLANKLGKPVTDVKKMTVWGNHSTTQYPDLMHCEIGGQNAAEAVDDQAWIEERVHPERGQARRRDHRGARRVQRGFGGQRGCRSRPRLGCTARPDGDWVSMGVPSDGSYGVPEGIIAGFPCTASGGEYSIVQGLEIDDFSRARIDASAAELSEERAAVEGLGLL